MGLNSYPSIKNHMLYKMSQEDIAKLDLDYSVLLALLVR